MLEDMKGIVEGEMTIPIARNNGNLGSPDFNTLDEPIRETIVTFHFKFQEFIVIYVCFLQLRDLKAVGTKFAHVLIPSEKTSLLKECKLD